MRIFIILVSLVLSVVSKSSPQFTSQYGVPSPSSVGGRASGSGGGRIIGNSNSRGNSNSGRTASSHDFNLISSALGTSTIGQDSSSFSYVSDSSLNPAMSIEEMQRMIGGPKVYKHVSIHIPPKEEFQVPMKRTIRPMMKPDKHVNIIFVKAPSASSSQQTEVILPEQSEQKTVVYILVRKQESGQSDIKIRAPQPTKPSKPEVFFVQYGNRDSQQQQQQQQQQSGPSEGSLEEVNEIVNEDNASKPVYGVPQSKI